MDNELELYYVVELKAMLQVETISVCTSQREYKFYEKCGFKLVEVSKDYWAPGFDMYRMIYQH